MRFLLAAILVSSSSAFASGVDVQSLRGRLASDSRIARESFELERPNTRRWVFGPRAANRALNQARTRFAQRQRQALDVVFAGLGPEHDLSRTIRQRLEVLDGDSLSIKTKLEVLARTIGEAQRGLRAIAPPPPADRVKAVLDDLVRLEGRLDGGYTNPESVALYRRGLGAVLGPLDNHPVADRIRASMDRADVTIMDLDQRNAILATATRSAITELRSELGEPTPKEATLTVHARGRRHARAMRFALAHASEGGFSLSLAEARPFVERVVLRPDFDDYLKQARSRMLLAYGHPSNGGLGMSAADARVYVEHQLELQR
jgi:hypothetical protein